ncbi:MAG: 50S ribosomal protein L25 [Thermoanaerobaculia bacterium]
MLQENIVVEVEKRLTTGKNAANRLRAQDQIPAVLYGGGKDMETWSLQVPRKTLATLLNKGLHGNAIFKLNLKGTDQTRHVMIRDLALDPVSRKMLHVDFVRVLLDRKLRVKSEIEIEGVANGVKTGGILNIVTHEILIECLPADIPESVKVDVSAMEIHDSLRVSDLKLGDKIKVLENADRVLAHVGVPKAEEVPVAAVAAAVPGAEGAAAAPAEPEVIKKGKKEEEGAEAAPAKPEAKAEKKEKK